MPKAHAEYLAFQKALVRRVAAEVRGELGHLGTRLRSYYLAYLRDVASYDRVASREELLSEVARARFVLGGDYHSFDQSKKTHLRILRHELKRRRAARAAAPIAIALECLQSRHQEDLDRFMDGSLDDEGLLSRTRYRETWGFPFLPYREILRFARENGLPAVAVNLGGRASLSARDQHMAERLAATAAAHPGALVYLVVGDWHLARGHLPRALAARAGSGDGTLLIFQNAESIYWKLAARKLEQTTDVVRIRPRAYCVVNATPFVKLASYALWTGHPREAEELARDGILAALSARHARRGSKRSAPSRDDEADELSGEDGGGDLSDTLALFVGAIARFFDLHAPIDFALVTSRDASLMEVLMRDLSWRGPDFLHEIAVYLYHRRCFYVPEIRTVYVGTPAVNQLGDVAATYIYYTLSGAGPPPEEPRAGFYTRALRETVAFMGSKIINHKRPFQRRADYERTIAESAGLTLLGVAKERELVAKSYLRHRALEKEFFARGRVPGPRLSVYRQRPVVRWGLTRGLGQALGHKLYEAMVTGALGKDVLRELFLDPFREPLKRYMELVRRTREIRASVKVSEERM
ncbi:MAG: ChaN family lipoprotein [Acidobacteriota bacterium]